jgi:hypothetical protein
VLTCPSTSRTRYGMKPIIPKPRLVSLLAVLACVALAAAGEGLRAEEVAEFTVDTRLGDVAGEGVQVRLECETGDPVVSPVVRSALLPRNGTKVFQVSAPAGRNLTCTVSVDTPPGIEVIYRGDGGSETDIGYSGCRFTGVRAGHANFCQIEVRSRTTSVTVYKKWIGAKRKEPGVRIELVCAGEQVQASREINTGRPGGWFLEVTDPEGVTCDVFEEKRDEFIPDERDCRNLLVLPGSEEECTLVNTKVVKMIEMLNRYGLVIMILVFLAVGMAAARRFVP